MENIFSFGMMCMCAPLSLVIFLCLGKYFTKYDKESAQQRKDFLWLKVEGTNKQLKVNERVFGTRIVSSCCWIYIIFCVFIVLQFTNLYMFDPNDDLYTLSGCLTVAGCLAGAITIISLILASRKDFYLGIDAKDVVSQSYIPGCLANMYAGSIYMFLGYLLCNVNVPKDYTVLAKLWIFAAVFFIFINFMVVIQQTMKRCFSVDQKELQALHCFRRRVIDVAKLDENQVVSDKVIEKIAFYLLQECLHRFKQAKLNLEHLTAVRLYSAASEKENQTCLKEVTRRANLYVLLTTVYIEGLPLLYLIAHREKDCFIMLVIMNVVSIVLSIGLYAYGCKNKLWLLFFNARYYYVFCVADPDSDKISNEVAEFGIITRRSKRYEAVALMEDILGFYKMLLYDKKGRKYRYVVIEQIVNNRDEKNAKVCGAQLLLLYYAEYEKIYLKLERKKNRGIISRENQLIPDETFLHTVNRKVFERKVIDYDLLNDSINLGETSPVEFQLADAILSEKYKETLVQDGNMVPEKLKNYKFESFYKHVQQQCNKV